MGLWRRCSKGDLRKWLLQLDHESMRSKAWQRLIACGERAVSLLAESLEKTDSKKRQEMVVNVLCEIGAPALKQLLVARKRASIAPCVDGALEEYLPKVVESRQHEREYTLVRKKFWNRSVHSEQIVDRLIALLDDDDPIVQEGAALALGQYRRLEVVRTLGWKLYECRNPQVKEMVAKSLGQTKLSDAVLYLSTGLIDRSHTVRLAACEVLGQIKHWKAIPALGGTLFLDKNRSVQIVAARALGHTGEGEAMEILEKALGFLPNDDDHHALRQIVGQEAAQLRKLGGEEAI